MSESVETPISDLLSDLARELEEGWRLKAEAPSQTASHSCGLALSAAVGRIIRDYLGHAALLPHQEGEAKP